MVWFTSDHHFGHRNIIDYTGRPFNTLEEMDAEMIRRWNEVVGGHDTIYHLGDFTLGNAEMAGKYISQLNGKIYILNNPFHHDRRWLSQAETMHTASNYQVGLLNAIHIIEHKRVIVLCHYPIDTWDRKHYDSVHLYGHTHRRKALRDNNAMNVCVDLHNFYPVSINQVFERLA